MRKAISNVGMIIWRGPAVNRNNKPPSNKYSADDCGTARPAPYYHTNVRNRFSHCGFRFSLFRVYFSLFAFRSSQFAVRFSQFVFRSSQNANYISSSVVGLRSCALAAALRPTKHPQVLCAAQCCALHYNPFVYAAVSC